MLLAGLRSQWVKEREAADKDKRRRQAEWRAAMDMGVQHRKARNMQLKAERSQEQVELQERQEAAKVGRPRSTLPCGALLLCLYTAVVICLHNLAFDGCFLQYALAACRLKLARREQPGARLPRPCTMT